MPNVKSAEKRLRQSEGRTLRNRIAKSSIKTLWKRAVSAIESGDKTNADKELKLVVSKLDTVSRKGIIHKKQAARKKSNIMRLYNKKFA